MATRPTTLPTFCTANPSGRVQPPTSLVESGYTAGTSPAAETINWLFGTVGDTLAYLDSQSGSLQLASTLDSSCRLLGDASFSWSLSTRTLAWDAALYIAIPSQADAANAIAAGNVSIPSGSVAFVTANVPFSTSASLTAQSATLASVLYADLVSVGMAASGTGISTGATVTAVDASAQTVTLSAAATATTAAQTVTFSSSGTLSVQVQPSSSFVPTANQIIIARATATTVHVGVNASTLRLHDNETKQLGEDAYLSLTRPTAGAALTAGQAVYVSQGANDTDSTGASTGRTAGLLYPADASASFQARSGVAGFVPTASASGSVAPLVSQGILTGLSGLTPGAVYFLSATTPGAMTLTAPTAAGTTAVPLGTALSATRLLINPAAASQAKANSPNLTLAGTLTANSVVSAQGFSQQVSMGSLYIPAKTTFPSVSTPGVGGTTTVYTPQPLQKSYPVYASNTANVARRVWFPGKAGSILNVQFFLSANPGQPLLVSVRLLANQGSESELFAFSGTAFPSGGFYGYFYPLAKAAKSFGRFDAVAVSVAFASAMSSDLIVDCTMTAEMAA